MKAGIQKKSVFLLPLTDGALAQLARVSDWQSGGHGSDSRMLHKNKRLLYQVSVFFVSLRHLFKLVQPSVINVNYLFLMKKTILFLLLLVAIAGSLRAQRVYSTNYKSEADVKVYVTEYRSEADIIVYKTKYKSDATDNKGIWYFTEYKSEAKKIIYFTDYRSEADIKVYFTQYKSETGWKNKSKQHLLY